MFVKYKINIDDTPDKTLNNLFYIGMKNKKELCKYIKQFFIQNNLIQYQ